MLSKPLFAASEELIDPAVKGTVNVLTSCTKFPSIKRVVLTSSMAAVMFNKTPVNTDAIIDETWFSDPVYCEESKLWYHLSKTLAEDAAWKLAREKGIDLVTINPGFVIGPLLQPTLNSTAEGILNLIKNGTEFFSDAIYRYVDVRDVALAHIQAFEVPSASGRYCVVGTVTHSSEALNILHNFYPSLNLPKRAEGEKHMGPPYQISKKKAESLGINFIPLEVSLKDTVESFKEKNFLMV
ncbi:Cinnamoyl-CoA reductase [Actinidia chinensis var. chinensis]|uniref:Dihydroflavonol 4-reductase n=1 Tax=Actinidia chinensis var. chinensis TaxID=1590841 RepID=A0A2R6RD32_ACTCC|nr:Cinnamoyl-CoA reductase [Actinidia chinensis var. chinensis]